VVASADIAIVGGGPAGAAAAILLARNGARVTLIDDGLSRPRIEGLSPRVLQILQAHRFEAAGVGPAVPRAIDWGALGATPNHEHPVERRAFDAALRRQAEREDVTVIRARAGRLSTGQVTLPGGTLRAGLVVDARGRAAPVARGRLRGPQSIAIVGWAGPPTNAGASISARSDGWVWRVTVPRTGDWIQLVRDAHELAPGAGGLAEAWREAIGGPAPGRLAARAAELRLTSPRLDPALPRIGDAAVALDPLSGHGVFWAISSALAAPPMLRAILDGQVVLACAFYRDRVAATFWRQARIGRDFHRMSGLATPFWASRSAWPDDEPAHRRVEAASLRHGVVVRDGRLVEAEVLVTPREPDGVAYVAGREIAPVLRRLGGSALPGRAEFCARILPEAPPAEAALVHDWLVDRGVRALPPTAGHDRQMEVTA
jgi:menaquinone-9 beta-reductase